MLRGRIIKGIGGNYYVDTGDSDVYECSVRGIFRKNKITPTVGDFVEVLVLDENTKKGSIEKINDRKNILIRPRVSNIDCAIITFACKSPNINFDLLDRFLILAETEKIQDIIICINKCDLMNNEVKNKILKNYSNIYKIIFISTFLDDGFDELKELINEKVSVFAGPSGVGKSSIINKLIPKANLKTGVISAKIERGKHTTRQVELLKFWENTFILDSPGFTSLSLDFLDAKELKLYFKDFVNNFESCKFNDCVHLHEPGCSIKEKVGKDISLDRYERYKYLYNELENKR